MSNDAAYYKAVLREQRNERLSEKGTTRKRDARNELYDDPLTPNGRSQRNIWALRGLLTTAFLYLLLFCALGSVLYKVDNLQTRQGFFVQIIGNVLRHLFGKHSS